MGRFASGALGIIAGLLLAVVSFVVLLGMGATSFAGNFAFNAGNPIVAAAALVFYLAVFIAVGSPLYFWILKPVIGMIRGLVKEEE